MRTAVIIAASLEVTCPHCGEAQPNPHGGGSHIWTAAEVRKEQDKKLSCVSCEEPFMLLTQNRVSVLD